MDPAGFTPVGRLEAFLKGLKPYIRGLVESQNPSTLEQAINSAEALDQCHYQSSEPRQERPPVPYQERRTHAPAAQGPVAMEIGTIRAEPAPRRRHGRSKH